MCGSTWMMPNNRCTALILLLEKLEVLISNFLELEFIVGIMPNEINFRKCPPKMRIHRHSYFATGIP
jgi:hypothetical protein